MGMARASHSPSPSRTIVASGMGTFIEWFDWSLFGLFAVYFSQHYFPSEEAWVSMLATGLTFAVAFVFRPIGGWVLGLVADRQGRRKAMVAAMALMAFGSLLIGITPGYDTIGIFAPALLILARVAQGVSTGGDSSNVYIYMSEIAPEKKRYRYGSFVYIFSGGAFLAASLIGYFQTSLLDDAAMSAWGWRVPFILGGVVGVVGIFLRLRLDESLGKAISRETSPEAQATEAGSYRNPDLSVQAKHPLWSTIRYHWRSVLQLVGFTFMMTLVYYAITVTFPTYAVEVHQADSREVFLAITIATIVYIALHYPVGALADSFGARPILLATSAMFAVMIVPLSSVVTGTFSGMVIMFTVALGVFAPLSALAPVIYSDLFPATIRGAGLGTWYNIAVALFGGTVSLVMTYVTKIGRSDLFFWYIALSAAMGFLAIFSMKKTMVSKANRVEAQTAAG